MRNDDSYPSGFKVEYEHLYPHEPKIFYRDAAEWFEPRRFRLMSRTVTTIGDMLWWRRYTNDVEHIKHVKYGYKSRI